MQDSAKAILNIFNNLGYEAYYDGEKCRNELYNELCKGNHLRTLNTTIVTNASVEQICKMFSQHKINESNPMIVQINFGNEIVQIESFHSVQYYIKEPEQFLSIPVVNPVATLEEDFMRKVFTINCVAQDKEEMNFFGNNARLDMTNKVIKTIDTSKDVFYEYPVRTLQAFSLMSQTGFKIDKSVLKNIKSTMRYLRFMPSKQVGAELRKIIIGKYAVDTLKLMQKIGIFNSKCLVMEDKVKIMTTFHTCDENRFDILNSFKKSSEIELELWSVLFDDVETAEKELAKFGCFSKLELHTILWLMNNKNLCEQATDEDYRMAIYNSITKVEKKYGIHYLKDLILKANHIYRLLSTSTDKKEKTKKLFFNLCARPYFSNQLTINIDNKDKEVLIEKLLHETSCPIDNEALEKFFQYNCK